MWSTVSEATEKWTGIKISEVVGCGYGKVLGANLRGLTGAVKVQARQWVEKTEVRTGR